MRCYDLCDEAPKKRVIESELPKRMGIFIMKSKFLLFSFGLNLLFFVLVFFSNLRIESKIEQKIEEGFSKREQLVVDRLRSSIRLMMADDDSFDDENWHPKSLDNLLAPLQEVTDDLLDEGFSLEGD